MTGDDFTLIELHKMAAERGDGLIPEMLDVLRHSSDVLEAGADLVQFPEGEGGTRVAVRPALNVNNVIAFPIARRGVTRR